MSSTVIKVENLSKVYKIRHQRAERYTALRDVMADAMKSAGRKLFSFVGRNGSEGKNGGRPSRENFHALKDVSFEVKGGESVGIIGRNGAGKSTLLKVLSRITEPTAGRVGIKGRVASLLEVGTGFHPELTGRENIYLNGSILGMSRAEVKRKFDEIVGFAEIDKFLDTPVKRYSSGMYVRLAFAVAAHLDTEILVVDEVLAVGDLAFQNKCLGKMGEVAQKGRTVLFVSHNMGIISQMCPRCLWLDTGEVKDSGPTAAIVSSYMQASNANKGDAETLFAENSTTEAQLRRVRLVNGQGDITRHFQCDEPVFIDIVFQVHKRTPGTWGYLMIAKLDGARVLESDSYDTAPNPMDDLPVGFHNMRIVIPARTLAPGDYTVQLSFTSRTASEFYLHDPGIVGGFSLDDFTSARGNNRLGFFSTQLQWIANNGIDDVCDTGPRNS